MISIVDNSKPPNLVHTAHVRAGPNADPVLTLQVGTRKEVDQCSTRSRSE